MAHNEWQERSFWDGSTAIFLKSYGAMSCYNINSEELHIIIEHKIAECDREKSVWVELQKKCEDANEEASD